MKRFVLALAAAALLLSARGAAAQPADAPIEHLHINPTLRIAQNFDLKQGETVRQIVVIGGDVTIAGTVEHDVVVVLGQVQLAPTAVVEGSLVVTGGNLKIADGARVYRELFVLGGYERSATFTAGGNQVVIGTEALGSALRNIVPWLLRGLLMARPIVPDLWWVWWVAGTFFVVNLLLNLLFDGPIRAGAATLRATPMTAFTTGLLVLLLAGPVFVLLAVSVVGIAVIPFVLFAIVIAGILGKVSFARWLGMRIVAQEDPEDRMQSLRSFAIGSAVMCIAYMIPVIGMITWAMAGVMGLGAATLAFHAAYRRENPKKPKPVRPVVPPTASGGDAGSLGSSALPPGDSGMPQPALSSAVDLPLEGGSYPTSPIDSPGSIASPAGRIGGQAAVLALPRAAFVERLAAFTLDFILIVIVSQALNLDRGPVDGPLGRAGMLLAIAYHVGFWTWKGTTLGGIITNLRVIRTDGAPLQFAEALVRGLTGIFSLAVAGLGFFWILRDPERQSWHDRVAGTYVVKVPRDYPL
jgi:uncharacterized RDD family membrane protein YckC